MTCLMRICDMAHSDVTRLIHMLHASFIYDMTHSYVTRLIQIWRVLCICHMTCSYVARLIYTWHDSFTFFFLSGTVAVHMWHDLFIRGTTHLLVTRFVYIWHDFICKCDTTQEATYEWLMSHVRKYRNDSRGNGTMKRRLMNDVWCMLEMCMHECFLCNRMHMLTTLSRESGCTGSL